MTNLLEVPSTRTTDKTSIDTEVEAQPDHLSDLRKALSDAQKPGLSDEARAEARDRIGEHTRAATELAYQASRQHLGKIGASMAR